MADDACNIQKYQNQVVNISDEIDSFEGIIKVHDDCVNINTDDDERINVEINWLHNSIWTSTDCENVNAIINVLVNTREKIKCVLKNHSIRITPQTSNITIKDNKCPYFISSLNKNPHFILENDLPEDIVNLLAEILFENAQIIVELLNKASSNASKLEVAYQLERGNFVIPVRSSLEQVKYFKPLLFKRIVREISHRASIKNGIIISVEMMAGKLCNTSNEHILLLIAQSMIEQTMEKFFSSAIVEAALLPKYVPASENQSRNIKNVSQRTIQDAGLDYINARQREIVSRFGKNIIPIIPRTRAIENTHSSVIIKGILIIGFLWWLSIILKNRKRNK